METSAPQTRFKLRSVVHNDLLSLSAAGRTHVRSLLPHSALKPAMELPARKGLFVQAMRAEYIFFISVNASKGEAGAMQKSHARKPRHTTISTIKIPNHFYPHFYFLSLFRHLDFFQLLRYRKGVAPYSKWNTDEIARSSYSPCKCRASAQICGGEQLQRVA